MMRLIWIPIVLLCAAVPAAAEDPLGKEIDHLLSGRSRRWGAESAAERLRPFGDEAIVRLIARYEAAGDERLEIVPPTLCLLGTKEGLEFVLALLKKGPDAAGLEKAIHFFPVKHEDRLLTLLIPHAGHKVLWWPIGDRLKKAIRRTPARAGLVVDALRDDPKEKLRMRRLRDVLGRVAGYSGHWPCFVSPKTPENENAFWREWWKRNAEKDRIGWLDEALARGGGPRSSGTQELAVMGDPATASRLVRLLDDEQRSVRYWAVYGLRKLEGTLPEGGYLSEIFRAEEATEIPRLKKAFTPK